MGAFAADYLANLTADLTGRVLQAAPPASLYAAPCHALVARAVGAEFERRGWLIGNFYYISVHGGDAEQKLVEDDVPVQVGHRNGLRHRRRQA